MTSRGNSSGAGSVSRSVSRKSTPTTCRAVMDLDVDDDDDDWEDEGTQLKGLGTTTHRSRHPHKTVIARKRRTRVVGAKRTADDEAARANALATAKSVGLAEDLDDWQAQSEERAQELSEKYGMKVKEVCRALHASSAFKPRRKVSVYNAKISALVLRLNKGRDIGHRYTMPDIKQMRTVERLMEEITSLAEQSGMIRFAMFTRGHIHDSSIPVTLESWGVLGFFREVLKRDPADIAALFELWAKECTELIKAGLHMCLTCFMPDAILIGFAGTITGQMKIAMNYDNYIKAIVEAKNVGLLGWPHGVYFKRMSLQSAISPLHTLRDALKARTCKWAILSAHQKKQLLTDFKEMVANGEATEKVAKPKGKGKKKVAGEVRKSSRTGKKGAAQLLSNDEEEESASEEGEDVREDASEDEQRARRIQRRQPLGVLAREEQRRKLLALVAHKKAGVVKGAGKGGERGHKHSRSMKTTSGKRKRPADANKDTPAAKKKRTSGGEHRHCTDEDDDPPPAKRAKTSKLTATSASKPSTTSGVSGCTKAEAEAQVQSAASSRAVSPLRATAVAPAHTASTVPAATRSPPPSRAGSPPHSTPPSPRGSATSSCGRPPPSRAGSPPRSTPPSPRGSAMSSRGRANTVRGKRGGPPGRWEMPERPPHISMGRYVVSCTSRSRGYVGKGLLRNFLFGICRRRGRTGGRGGHGDTLAQKLQHISQHGGDSLNPFQLEGTTRSLWPL
ncbi:hypothetical protein B0H14DRAFT_2595805 [Mycena olivaceomarginata]|nr:hypothetical protein B0H14DRAFT_2595805 [Mycena olivaceomarginata]